MILLMYLFLTVSPGSHSAVVAPPLLLVTQLPFFQRPPPQRPTSLALPAIPRAVLSSSLARQTAAVFVVLPPVPFVLFRVFFALHGLFMAPEWGSKKSGIAHLLMKKLISSESNPCHQQDTKRSDNYRNTLGRSGVSHFRPDTHNYWRNPVSSHPLRGPPLIPFFKAVVNDSPHPP